MQRKVLLMGTLLAGFALPASASAQTALVTTDLNMRAGPSPEFPVVATLPEDARVRVHGCLAGYNWCDVSWQDERGWAYGAYLSYPYDNRYVVIGDYGSEIDLPIVTFSVGPYWDRYYRGRPWYEYRSRWVSRWRDDDRRRGYGYRTRDSDRVARPDRDRAFSGERRDRGDRTRARVREDRTSERFERRDAGRVRGGARVETRTRGDAAIGGGAGTSGAARVDRGGGGGREGGARDRR